MYNYVYNYIYTNKKNTAFLPCSFYIVSKSINLPDGYEAYR